MSCTAGLQEVVETVKVAVTPKKLNIAENVTELIGEYNGTASSFGGCIFGVSPTLPQYSPYSAALPRCSNTKLNSSLPSARAAVE